MPVKKSNVPKPKPKLVKCKAIHTVLLEHKEKKDKERKDKEDKNKELKEEVK